MRVLVPDHRKIHLRGHLRVRHEHTWRAFLQRTVSAQIHLLGLIAALGGLVPLLLRAARTGQARDVVACAIFGLSGALVFSVSTLYHLLHDGLEISKRLEDSFESLDHASIYIFIAGTYTPFLFRTVRQPWLLYLLVGIWSIVAFGIAYTVLRDFLPAWMKSRTMYTALFVLMGWTLLFRIGEVYAHMTAVQLFFLLSGAVAYTGGAIVYARKSPRFFPPIFGFHEFWHVCVVLGFSFHYTLIYSLYGS